VSIGICFDLDALESTLTIFTGCCVNVGRDDLATGAALDCSFAERFAELIFTGTAGMTAERPDFLAEAGAEDLALTAFAGFFDALATERDAPFHAPGFLHKP
jgi:hypothetical protein